VNELATNLPAIIDATLPAPYEAARHAITECEYIDEAKKWAYLRPTPARNSSTCASAGPQGDVGQRGSRSQCRPFGDMYRIAETKCYVQRHRGDDEHRADGRCTLHFEDA
jgi:hypothetical protein